MNRRVNWIKIIYVDLKFLLELYKCGETDTQ